MEMYLEISSIMTTWSEYFPPVPPYTGFAVIPVIYFCYKVKALPVHKSMFLTKRGTKKYGIVQFA